MNVPYTVEVKVIYVPGKEKKKNGEPKLMRVEHRKMFLKDKSAFLDSGDYRIVHRKGKYTISVIPRIAQPCWSNPSGKYAAWYKTPPNVHYDDGSVERPYKRTDDPAMDEAGILSWLAGRLGLTMAKIALETLLTQEPEQAEAA